MTIRYFSARFHPLDAAIVRWTDEACAARLRPLLTEEDHAAAHRHERASRRWQTLWARGLMRHRLHDWTGVSAEGWRLVGEPGEKPRLIDPSGDASWQVSLTHSGPWVGCALSRDGAVGLDVESPRPGRHPQEFLDWFTAPEERERILREDEAGLLTLWTVREAWAKAHGLGWESLTRRTPRLMERDGGQWFVQDGAAGIHARIPGVHAALVWLAPPTVVVPEQTLRELFSAMSDAMGSSSREEG